MIPAISLSLLVIALAVTASAASADTLDQQQTDTSVNGYIVGPSGSPTSSAETFTAGLSGGLDRVDLFLNCFGCNTIGVTVQIRSASGGAPGATVLATASIPAASVGSAPGAFIPAAFSNPATVQAGTQYTIVAFTGGSDGYRWLAAPGTPYSGGQGFISGASPPGTWLAAGKTFAFKTYVNVTVPQPPGPTGRRAAALAKCKHKHGKKRKKCKRRAKSLPV